MQGNLPILERRDYFVISIYITSDVLCSALFGKFCVQYVAALVELKDVCINCKRLLKSAWFIKNAFVVDLI